MSKEFKPIVPATVLMARAREAKAARKREREARLAAFPPTVRERQRRGRPKGLGGPHTSRGKLTDLTIKEMVLTRQVFNTHNRRMRAKYYKYLVGEPLYKALLDDSGDKVVLPPKAILTIEVLDSLTLEQLAMVEVEPKLSRAIEEKLGRSWDTKYKLQKRLEKYKSFNVEAVEDASKES